MKVAVVRREISSLIAEYHADYAVHYLKSCGDVQMPYAKQRHDTLVVSLPSTGDLASFPQHLQVRAVWLSHLPAPPIASAYRSARSDTANHSSRTVGRRVASSVVRLFGGSGCSKEAERCESDERFEEHFSFQCAFNIYVWKIGEFIMFLMDVEDGPFTTGLVGAKD